MGDNPDQLARYSLALETVGTYFRALGPDAIVEPGQVSTILRQALRAVGANEALTQLEAAQLPLWGPYADPDFRPDNTPGEAISTQELRNMYGPPKAGNPYDPSDPLQLIGYGLYQSGMKENAIAPILLGIAARQGSVTTPSTSESTGASGR